MPVITPPSPGNKEEESRNWYRSESLRHIHANLEQVRDEVSPDSTVVIKLINDALTSIAAARLKLSPPRKPAAPPVMMDYNRDRKSRRVPIDE